MKKLLITLLLSYMITTPAIAQNPLARLEGTWYVNLSNFKMWLKGNKHNPSFTYTIATKKNVVGLKDDVSYHKNKKQKHIIGFDKPLNDQATSFVWCGKGLLTLFKSKWQIIFQTEEWTLIHFEKTLATAEGYDVISRQKNMNADMVNAIRIKLKELGIINDLQVISQN